jgi:hypothetical protein
LFRDCFSNWVAVLAQFIALPIGQLLGDKRTTTARQKIKITVNIKIPVNVVLHQKKALFELWLGKPFDH